MDSNSKRIAKNTLLLYIRMLVLMCVNLYTSRIILQVLGVSDFGIYNVVGGFVAMFSIISSSLTAAISRFLTFELGRGDTAQLSRVFSSSVTIQVGLSAIILLLAESIGLWFLNNKLSILPDRMVAANWVYHFSLATFVVNLISVPYNSAIIAHEKMGAFAYISIFEGFAKLIISFLVFYAPFDKLVYYAVLMFIVALIVRMLYTIYCKRYFEECKFHFVLDRDLLHKMFGFAGWNIIGASSGILRDQGGNIILNIFFGTTINAARGIAWQVKGAVTSFSSNFMMALNPQITKSYAQGNRDYMMALMFQGARFSYYILLLLSLPIIINTPYILHLWLTEVPEHTVTFVRLVLLLSMEESISYPLVTGLLATGRIKKYQLIVGGLNMLNLPVAYVLLWIGAIPESIFIAEIVIGIICLVARLLLLKKILGISITDYFKGVLLNIVFITSVSSVVPLWLLKYSTTTLISFILLSMICILSVSFVVWSLGLKSSERKILQAVITKRFSITK